MVTRSSYICHLKVTLTVASNTRRAAAVKRKASPQSTDSDDSILLYKLDLCTMIRGKSICSDELYPRLRQLTVA